MVKERSPGEVIVRAKFAEEDAKCARAQYRVHGRDIGMAVRLNIA